VEKNIIYKIHKYDHSKYNFYRPILDYLKAIPKFKNITSIEDISKMFSATDLSEIEQAIYKYLKSDEFLNLYQKFNMEVISQLIPKKYKVQKVPAVRVSLPGQRSVNFHNDCWYGHGANIENFWIPLTNVRGSQALAFLDSIENEKAIEYFKFNELSLLEIQKYCEERAQLIELNYGEFLHFPTSAIHGTFTNDTKNLRISFDFRINHDGARGYKSYDFFSDIDKLNNPIGQSLNSSILEKTAIGYVSQRGILDNFFVSQTIQQEANVSYCERNNLSLIAQETELMGFRSLINLKDIFFGNRKNKVKNVVIFSDKLIDDKDIKNKKILDDALELGYRLHFVNEGYVLQKESATSN
tara:strand:+ start:91 stop:1155 length:1065 start_codon:yes stop_codon:yes gene_type:complete